MSIVHIPAIPFVIYLSVHRGHPCLLVVFITDKSRSPCRLFYCQSRRLVFCYCLFIDPLQQFSLALDLFRHILVPIVFIGSFVASRGVVVVVLED